MTQDRLSLRKFETATDLAKEDFNRAMSVAHKLPWNSERPRIELSK